jgi:hypothetical protein
MAESSVLLCGMIFYIAPEIKAGDAASSTQCLTTFPDSLFFLSEAPKPFEF